MKKIITALIAAALCALPVSVYAAEDQTVNGLPPCNSYDNAIYREVHKSFSGESFGRVRKGENGNFFVTIGGTPMEFAIEGKTVRTIGLKDYTEHQTLAEIGQEHLYSFESPEPEEPQTDYDLFDTAEESTPELPDFNDDPIILPNGEQPVVEQTTEGEQEETSFSIPDELFTGNDPTAAKAAIISFYAEATEEAQFRVSRWIASRPLISEMTRSGNTLTGKVKGIVNEYAITVNEDGTLTLEDTAWMEFPQWSALKR